MLGIIKGNKRIFKYINRKYIDENESKNFLKYKILVPKSNGSGALGEVLSTPLIGYTQSFIGFGAFDTRAESENLLKYIKTKFCRALLGILKITQDNPPEKWRLVPMQDFTHNSDINWTASIKDIDKQLYKKYNLSKDEIKFIETRVQAME